MAPTISTQFTTGHVGLNVSNLGRSKRFYQQIFGFDIVAESNDESRSFALLGQRDSLVLTLWQQSNGAFTVDRPGLHHLSFQVDTIEEVKSAEERLRALGAVIHHDGIVPHHEGADSGGLFFEDPDGIRLEIFASAGAGVNAAPHGKAPTCGFF